MLFTRRETMSLTSSTSNQLQHLERVRFIIPKRIGQSPKPVVLYSIGQIISIKLIRQLRGKVTAIAIKKMVELICNNDHIGEQLVFIDDDVFWTPLSWDRFANSLPERVKEVSQKQEQISQHVMTVVPTLEAIAKDICKTAEESDAINFKSFEERAYPKLLKLIHA